ncbi:hypothetical protein PNOK_0160300 [Pyrrhoderma noxium]|uniref:Uncharacterized protein n=1 Tax=Pyrrhoderma noxium TaxID=2282107 RepID=A0A286UPX6_9AGAM|nr:hypothetical protein PNOK_0160300 [Pyrrhoderma noxium]
MESQDFSLSSIVNGDLCWEEHENSAHAFLSRTLDGDIELNNKVYNPSISASTKSILLCLYDEGRHDYEGKVIGGSEHHLYLDMTEKVLSDCSPKPFVDAVTYTATYNALVGFYQALREEFKPSEGRLSVFILGKSIQFINLLENGYLNKFTSQLYFKMFLDLHKKQEMLEQMKGYLDHNKLDLYQSLDIPVDNYERPLYLELREYIDSWMNDNQFGLQNIEGKYRIESRFGKAYRFTKFGNSRQWKLTILTDIAFTLAQKLTFFNFHGSEFKAMDPSGEAILYYFENYLFTPLVLSKGRIEKSILFILDFTLLDSTESIDSVVTLIELLSQLPPKIRFLILGIEKGGDGKYKRYDRIHKVPLLTQSTNM